MSLKEADKPHMCHTRRMEPVQMIEIYVCVYIYIYFFFLNRIVLFCCTILAGGSFLQSVGCGSLRQKHTAGGGAFSANTDARCCKAFQDFRSCWNLELRLVCLSPLRIMRVFRGSRP